MPSAVAVFTVLYNSSAHLKPFLDSLGTAENYAEVIVIDNNSQDVKESEKIAADWGATFLPLKKNIGYGGALNVGVKHLSTLPPYLLLCNPDISFREETISILTDQLEKLSSCAMVGPQILQDETHIYPSARAFPSLTTGIGHALLQKIAPNNRFSRKYHTTQHLATSPQRIDWLSGACMLIKSEVFTELGGFDETYFMYFEDVDLCYRMDQKNYDRFFIPSAIILHTQAHSTQSNSRKMLHIHHQSAYRFLQKKFPGPLFFPVRVALKVGLTLRCKILTLRKSNSSS